MQKIDEVGNRFEKGGTISPILAVLHPNVDEVGRQYLDLPDEIRLYAEGDAEERAVIRQRVLKRLMGRVVNIRDLRQKLSEIPRSPAAERAMQAGSFGDFFDAVAQNPVSVIGTIVTESLPAAPRRRRSRRRRRRFSGHRRRRRRHGRQRRLYRIRRCAVGCVGECRRRSRQSRCGNGGV